MVSIEMELKKAFVCISKHLNTLFLILSELYHTNNTKIAPSISKSNMYSLLHRYPSSRKFYRLKTSQRSFFVDYIFPRLKENYNFRYYQFKMSRSWEYFIIIKKNYLEFRQKSVDRKLYWMYSNLCEIIITNCILWATSKMIDGENETLKHWARKV